MKLEYLFIITFASLFLFSGCEKDDAENERFETSVMHILPQEPNTGTEVKVVNHICNYDLFVSLFIESDTITLTRSFNSAMKQPCIEKTDTVSLGELSEGEYTLIYLLIDNSHLALGEVFFSDTLNFSVGN